MTEAANSTPQPKSPSAAESDFGSEIARDLGIPEETLENLEPEVRRKMVHMAYAEFVGPLPPPSTMARYEEIYAGAFDRILRLTEKETEHRHFIERGLLVYNVRLQAFGLMCGFVMGMGGLFAGTYLIVNGHAAWGVVAFLAAIPTLSGTLLNALRGRGEDRPPKEPPQEEAER